MPHYWLAVVVRVVVDFVVASSAVAAAAHTDVAAIVAAVAVVFVEIAVAGFAFYFVVAVATSLFYFSTNKNRKKIKLQPKKIHSLYLCLFFCSKQLLPSLDTHHQFIIHFYLIFY